MTERSDPNNSQERLSVDSELLKYRDQIDAIDQQVLGLLNQRAELAQRIGHVKAKTDAPVMRPEREAQVLDKLSNANQGPLLRAHVHRIFKEVMSACRSLEREIRVAYLGPVGTYSEQAVSVFFGHSIEALPVESIEEAFRQVQASHAEFAVVPVENSTEGSVARTLDALAETDVLVCGEVQLAIEHELLTQSGSLDGITKVCAHPQALAQCRHWLRQYAAHLPQEAVSSNGYAAQLASSDPTVAAIAGKAAREHYQLQAVQDHIQDDAHNTTRFLVLGRVRPTPSGKDKTSLIASVPNQPGAVHTLLGPLNAHQVSMTKLESRPARTGRWEYYFFIDIAGHQSEEPVRTAIEELQKKASYLRVLGSYPMADRA